MRISLSTKSPKPQKHKHSVAVKTNLKGKIKPKRALTDFEWSVKQEGRRQGYKSPMGREATEIVRTAVKPRNQKNTQELIKLQEKLQRLEGQIVQRYPKIISLAAKFYNQAVQNPKVVQQNAKIVKKLTVSKSVEQAQAKKAYEKKLKALQDAQSAELEKPEDSYNRDLAAIDTRYEKRRLALKEKQAAVRVPADEEAADRLKRRQQKQLEDLKAAQKDDVLKADRPYKDEVSQLKIKHKKQLAVLLDSYHQALADIDNYDKNKVGALQEEQADQHQYEEQLRLWAFSQALANLTSVNKDLKLTELIAEYQQLSHRLV